VSATSRVCSYDKPNVVGSRSEPAPTPPTPPGWPQSWRPWSTPSLCLARTWVVGHSTGGMVAQLFAAAHPDQIAGIVLVDSVPENQDRRAVELVRRVLPPDQVEALIAGMTAMPPPVLDSGQCDLPKSCEQMRANRTTSPLPAVPSAVLVHGQPLDNLPRELAEPYEPIWQQMQRDVAALVPGAAD
jgi:pimeloyl-ACP methyl ester carboxylesterase